MSKGGAIMANIQLLEEKMREKNISVSDMTRHLNIDRATWYRKKKNLQSFSIGQAEKICKLLNLSGAETTLIFFAS